MVKTFAQILGIFKNILKPNLIQKSSRIKVYNALALPILYGSEILTLIQKDKKRLAPIEMKFFLTSKGKMKFWKS